MPKIEDLRQEYLKDADIMASKSRFGYFSILPSAATAINNQHDKKIARDEHGKVKTQQRNIFSGLAASGVLKKSYFNYETSVYQGDPYIDPGKHDRQQQMKQSKRLAEKEVFRPLNLTKTPQAKSSYEYLPQKSVAKNKKNYIDQSGRVKSEARGVMTNTTFNVEKQRLKEFKYVHDPYNNHLVVQREEHQKSVKLRGEAPFKSSSPCKPEFYTYRQTYGTDQNCLKKGDKNIKSSISIKTDHEASFKPSACKKYDTFSYPQYIPSGLKPQAKTTRSGNSKQKQTFKLIALRENTKPSPSIALMKSNILKSMR